MRAFVFFLPAVAALVAHPALRTPTVVSRVAAGPQMSLGGGGVGRSIRSIFRAPRLPGVGKGGVSRGGIIRGCDGGVGGGGGGDEAVPAPEPADDDDESNPLKALWRDYETALDQKPLLMKALTSFTGFAIGDILAQKFIQKGDFDWCVPRPAPPSPFSPSPSHNNPAARRFRLFRMSSFGLLIHGTTSHWFYGMLDGKIPGKDAKAVFSKVFIDQVLWNPCFGVMFFSYVALLEAKGLQYVVDKTRNELLTQARCRRQPRACTHTLFHGCSLRTQPTPLYISLRR